jgi:hypothetical protein
LGSSELVPLLVPFDDRLFVVHSQNGGGDVAGEIYVPATDSATPMAASNQIWRYDPAMAWTGDDLLMVGGSNGPGLDDVALAYNPATDGWRTLDGPPDGVGGRSNLVGGPGVWTGEELVLWQEGLALDPDTGTWRSLTPPPPPRRAFPATVWTGTQIVVWGGCDASLPQCDDFARGLLSDGALYDVAADRWRPMADSPLAPGVHPTGVLADGELLLYAGGSSPDAQGAQAASYDPATDTWAQLPDPPIRQRRYATAAWTGAHFVVWGGEQTGDSWYDDGAAYDPATDTWIALPDPPPGSARDRHAMVWATDRLYIAGGWQTDGPLTFTPTQNG